MELRLVGLERDGASVSVARFGHSLESGQGPSKQGPALGMLGVAIKTCLQLLNRGGDFSRIVASGGSYSGRRVYRRGGFGTRGQPGRRARFAKYARPGLCPSQGCADARSQSDGFGELREWKVWNLNCANQKRLYPSVPDALAGVSLAGAWAEAAGRGSG